MVQASGRLGFTGETAIALNLKAGKFAKFAKDDENEALYLIIINESSEDAFSIRESSGYFYVPTKVMFDTLGYDYENNTIMFDLVRQISLDKDLQGQVYFMKQRQTRNKDKKNDIVEPRKRPRISGDIAGRTRRRPLKPRKLTEASGTFQPKRIWS